MRTPKFSFTTHLLTLNNGDAATNNRGNLISQQARWWMMSSIQLCPCKRSVSLFRECKWAEGVFEHVSWALLEWVIMWSNGLANFVIVGLLSGDVSLSRDTKCTESMLWALTRDCKMFRCCENFVVVGFGCISKFLVFIYWFINYTLNPWWDYNRKGKKTMLMLRIITFRTQVHQTSVSALTTPCRHKESTWKWIGIWVRIYAWLYI